MPDDTNPNDRSPPANDTEHPPPSDPLPVILAGAAQDALSAALDDLVRAYARVERVSMAIARAADLATPRQP